MGNTLKTRGIYEQGYGTVAKKIMRDRSISIGAKALYSYICSYVGGGETAWPGRATICADLGIGKDYFTRLLQELKKANYIEVSQQVSDKGVFRGNIYALVIEPCPLSPDTAAPCPVSPDTVKADTIINNVFIINNKEKEQQQQGGVVAALLAVGVSRKTAMQLDKAYPEDKILEAISYVNANTTVKNKAGFLVKAIEEGYTLSATESEKEDTEKIATRKYLDELEKAKQTADTEGLAGCLEAIRKNCPDQLS